MRINKKFPVFQDDKMSHLKEFNSESQTSDGRTLGDEWSDWNGRDEGTIHTNRSLFIQISSAVLIALFFSIFLLVYMVSPRLSMWAAWLPATVWSLAAFFVITTAVFFVLVTITVIREKNLLPTKNTPRFIFNLVFSNAFRVAGLLKISRDRLGHSFVKVSNSLARALKKAGRDEKLLILLPRCLAKEELKTIMDLKLKYPIDVHTVSGGELARKKVKELKPTAVIGIACERDLVSGIRDVGQKISVIGIPNERPEGPCKNTHINLDELVETIEFYLGKNV